MDDPVDSLVELDGNLRDIDRANLFFGGIVPVERVLQRAGAASILDVGCGSADLPRRLCRRARRRGRALRITCLDRSDQMLAIAERRNRIDGLTFVRGDATQLPFSDRSFDVAMCSLVLHHFTPPDAVALLRELRRVSRLTPLVCDLRRSAIAYTGARLLASFTRNRLSRHDGPVSVMRAYTPDEARELAARSGWTRPVARREPWFRMTLVDDAG